VVVDLCSSWEK